MTKSVFSFNKKETKVKIATPKTLKPSPIGNEKYLFGIPIKGGSYNIIAKKYSKRNDEKFDFREFINNSEEGNHIPTRFGLPIKKEDLAKLSALIIHIMEVEGIEPTTMGEMMDYDEVFPIETNEDFIIKQFEKKEK